MARKRTFSDRRRQESYSGRNRQRLSYGELEQRRRESASDSRPPERERARSAERPPAQREPARRQRRPVDMPASRATSTRYKPPRKRGLSGVHVAIAVVILLVVVIPVFYMIFIMPSPIGGLSPANGSYVKTPNVVVGASISRSFKPQDVTIKVDGKDISTTMKVDKKTVSSTVPLADGQHKAILQMNAGGLSGKKTASWSFMVDSTPPKVTLTEKKLTPLKTPGEVQFDFKGTVDKGATVKIDGKPITVDAKNTFKGSAVTTRAKSLVVSATDAAGNEGNAYIVTQKVTQAKGAHVSVYMAGSDNDLAKFISLCDRTELNALQIDLKDESGQIGFNLDYPLAQQVKATNNYINLESCVDQMRYRDIYTICRIVTFKDPKLGKGRPDLAVQDKAGGVWSKGVWLDPYSKEVWDYDIAVATAAARAGFNEIQFDYVRFPSDGDTTRCVFSHNDGRKPGEVIDSFLAYARDKLAPYNVFVSADLFGLTASKQGEMGIGQRVQDVANRVDFISPMVYPSHYNLGEYGIKVPEANPGDTVTKSVADFKKAMAGTGAQVRPWLQDFSLKIPYTPDMVRAQINACESQGVHQWLLWDPNCTYSESALKSTTQKK